MACHDDSPKNERQHHYAAAVGSLFSRMENRQSTEFLASRVHLTKERRRTIQHRDDPPPVNEMMLCLPDHCIPQDFCHFHQTSLDFSVSYPPYRNMSKRMNSLRLTAQCPTLLFHYPVSASVRMWEEYFHDAYGRFGARLHQVRRLHRWW